MRSVLGAVLLVLILSGCGATAVQPEADPAELSYPSLGIEADLEPTGLNSKGELAVPPITDPEKVVFLNWSDELGEGRPEVIASHVSGRDTENRSVPGGFADLKNAKTGDTFTVNDKNYTVRSVKTVDKDEFPTEEVYGPREGDWVVLITCGGELNQAERSYEDNVLVFAQS